MVNTARSGFERAASALGIGARPFDRLSIVVLFSSLYYAQVWGFLLLRPELGVLEPTNLLGLALVGLCILGVLESRLTPILFINAAFFVASYTAKAPVSSNNQTMAMFFSATVLLACAPLLFRHRLQIWRADREDVFKTIAGPGRWILAVMYFYGIYHKINADFINPEVSCGVVLYKALFDGFGMQNWMIGQWGSIIATFVVEFFAMVLLFSARFKKIGFIIGVPFHIIIGWSEYGYYMDFSTIVIATYALFLPAETPKNFLASAARWTGSEQRALTIMRALIVLAVGAAVIYIVGFHGGWRGFRMQWVHWAPIFTLYAILFYAFTVVYVPWRITDNLPAFKFEPRWAAIVPILFFISSASPYLGLRTEASIAMFSNLHTEGRQTNHLIHGVLPFGAHYQDDVIQVISTSDPGPFLAQFDARSGFRDLSHNIGFVRYEFDKVLADNPDIQVTFRFRGQVRTNDETWENTYLGASPLERAFLMFKPVDFERPKICTH